VDGRGDGTKSSPRSVARRFMLKADVVDDKLNTVRMAMMVVLMVRLLRGC
jgi:hypothetical protein